MSCCQCPSRSRGDEALEFLRSLCTGLDGAPAPDGQRVRSEEIPAPAQGLLVHESHMTHVLAAYYHSPPRLRVLQRQLQANVYRRKILLTCGPDPRPVEYGLVRLDLAYLSPAVRDEIIAGRTPLGAILTAHNVLRRVEPRWYLRFEASSPLLAWFGATEAMYGRIGTIYCDSQPAIELLEIVTGIAAAAP
jgi:chorismate-pyruvate lyase